MVDSPKVVSDPVVLLQKIAEVFPEVGWQAYRYVSEGWDHEVIILDERLVFRFPNDADYASQLTNEVTILKQLRPLVDTVRIPEYAYVAPDGSFAGYPMLSGQQLRVEYYNSLPADDQALIIHQLAGFLSAMHTAISRGHDFKTVPASYLAEDQKDVKAHALELSKLLSADDYAIVQAILTEVDELLAKPLASPVFLHADIYDSHILWDDESRQLGVIDFGDMNLGDPAVDFGELFEYGDAFAFELYRQYTGPKDDGFLERAWTYQRWAGVYMMTDYLINQKISFAEAREIFDRTKGRASLAS